MDIHSKEQRRKNMQAIKSRDTKIEVALGKALWSAGYRYRKNSKTIYGKPDFSFKKYKIAVFCDSEFFHGKDWEMAQKKIGTNREFWLKKIEGNINRDIKVNEELAKQGWTVLRFWEKDIKRNLAECVNQIAMNIELAKKVN
ncbi:MAG: very short patch repair endonuclease [Dyadobacter sp.]